jgi:hypothetical protein
MDTECVKIEEIPETLGICIEEAVVTEETVG